VLVRRAGMAFACLLSGVAWAADCKSLRLVSTMDMTQSNEMNSNIERRSDDIVLPEVIAGMDVLTKLHLYFAFQEHRLSLTGGGAAASQTREVGPVIYGIARAVRVP
jgi:hypothetical protein